MVRREDLRVVFARLEMLYGKDYVFEKAQDYVNQRRWENQKNEEYHIVYSYEISKEEYEKYKDTF